ncbi:MAG: DNA/RNA nuclease SfsA [Clostridiales bacterium]|nr:DNA/RNA nuclease SfsA [Clostridiales bacterium]
MRYKSVKKATFLSRPNRFIAQVLLDGEETTVHVKNTGRCRELLTPKATVYLAAAENPNRKTKYDLIAVEKGALLINMDAQAPNQVFREWAETGGFLPNLTKIRPEYRYKDSRFDFYMEQGDRRHLIEVKGVTLEENGVVRFPDAPTERGVKHLEGLTAALEEEFECWVCFVVQLSPARYLEPNDCTHPAFGEALRRASAAGVHVLAVSCRVGPDSLEISAPVPVHL